MQLFSIRWPRGDSRPQDLPRTFDPAWIHDPLRHPDIAQMNERELADLPLRAPRGPTCND
jgi:hypothetical protein